MTTKIQDGIIQKDGVDAIKFNTGGIQDKLHSIQAVANTPANSVTVTLKPSPFAFRSTTLTDGTSVTRLLNNDSTIVIPSGATLGAVNAVQSRIIVLAIDNNGTVEPAVVNISGGTTLDECGLINTVAITSGATSSSVVYSTTARTGVAYKVVGYFESTQATAGAWATTLSTVQGAGGEALSAMSSL